MASFTDSIQQFNPYIQQLPVEAMVQVGMEKQKRYDEGIQKVQSYVDSVAGLDVVKPLHKQYLQSKLNELGGRLKKVAAGDFSNYQLVNSVGGIATNIVKDPVIQNAVASTQRIRKGQSDIELAKKDGKYGTENEAFFNDQVNKWMSDPDYKTPFSGEYTPYRDVDAKLRALFKELPEIENIQDIPFKRDDNGNITNQIDEAMVSLTSKGKSAQRALDNFMASLSTDDLKQLQITGWYHYRGATKETLKADILTNAQTRKAVAQEHIDKISAELKMNPSFDSKQKALLEAEVNKYSSMIKNGEFEKAAQKQMLEIDQVGDIEAYKQNLYVSKYLGNTANALAYESVSQQVKNNPYFQSMMEIKKYNLDVAKYQTSKDQFTLDYNLRLRKQQLEEAESNFNTNTVIGGVYDKGIPTDIEGFSFEKLKETVVADSENLSLERDKVAGILGIKDYSTKSEEEKQKAFDLYLDAYMMAPSDKLDNVQIKALEKYRAGYLNHLGNVAKLKDIEKRSEEKFGEKEKELLGSYPSLSAPDGTFVTAEDALNIISVIEDVKQSLGQQGAMQPKLKLAKTLKEFEGTKYENIVKSYLTPDNTLPGGYSTKTESEKQVTNYINQLSGKLLSEMKGFIKEKTQFENQELLKLTPEVQSRVGTLNMNSKATAQQVDFALGYARNKYSDKGSLDLSKGQKYDPATIDSWLTEKGKEQVKFNLEKRGDGHGALIISKGEEEQTIPLTPSEMANLFPGLAGSNMFDEALKKLASSPNKTTNFNHTRDESASGVGAKFTGYNVQTLLKDTPLAPTVRFDIEGDMDNTGDLLTDLFQIRMYVFDPKTKQWKDDVINKNGFISASAIPAVFSQIGTTKYKEVLNKK